MMAQHRPERERRFEALAIADYLSEKGMPTLGVAAAKDMTQRHPSPWFVRLTSTSAQCAYPLAEYSAKELKYKKIVTIADDFAYGHEMCAGAGGSIAPRKPDPPGF